MSGAPPAAHRIAWQEATVTSVMAQTASVKSFFLRPPQWHGFRRRPACRCPPHHARRVSGAAQLFDRLGARGGDTIELVVEKLADGKVSPFFHEVVQPGDTIEMRGPIGGHFNSVPRRRPDPPRRRRLRRRAAHLDAPPSCGGRTAGQDGPRLFGAGGSTR